MNMETPQDNDAVSATRVSLTMETEPETGHHGDEEAEVWQSFEQSVTYMHNLSALYNDAFLTKKMNVPTLSHIAAAKQHAREALELLASNLLNASTAIVATMENQDEQLAVVDAKLQHVKQRLREQQEIRDEAIIHRFFAGSTARNSTVMPPSDSGTGSLKLTVASTSSSSSYLYL